MEERVEKLEQQMTRMRMENRVMRLSMSCATVALMAAILLGANPVEKKDKAVFESITTREIVITDGSGNTVGSWASVPAIGSSLIVGDEKGRILIHVAHNGDSEIELSDDNKHIASLSMIGGNGSVLFEDAGSTRLGILLQNGLPAIGMKYKDSSASIAMYDDGKSGVDLVSGDSRAALFADGRGPGTLLSIQRDGAEANLGIITEDHPQLWLKNKRKEVVFSAPLSKEE